MFAEAGVRVDNQIGQKQRLLFYGLNVFDEREDTDGDGIVDWVEFGFAMNPLEKEADALVTTSPVIRRRDDGTMEISCLQPVFPLLSFEQPNDGYGRNWFWITIQRSSDLLYLVCFENIAFLDIVETGELDTALKPLPYFLGVVLYATQCLDRIVTDCCFAG